MTIKSINQLVTDSCNSRCNMCDIWKIPQNTGEMTPTEFNHLYSLNGFREAEDLCISGGEPTDRSDLFEVAESILINLPVLKTLFLSTNGSRPKKIAEFVKRFHRFSRDIYVSLSLEGRRETHRLIRGVDTYNSVIASARSVVDLGIRNAHVSFSSTIQPINCNSEDLDHVRGLAREIGATSTFRPASKNNTFYYNIGSQNLMLSNSERYFLTNYIKTNCMDDPFLSRLLGFMNGERTIMGNREQGIECLAGKISVFIRADGNIYPCINSSRLIGDKHRGVYTTNYQLGGQYEPCPCFTECQVYPMLNFGGKNDRTN